MTADIRLYTAATLDEITWPETLDGDYARRYLLPLLRDGITPYIRNIHETQIMVLKAGEVILPLTVSGFHPENCYTCSPYSHYISYGSFEEVERLKNPPVEAAIRAVMRPVAWGFRQTDFDRVVYVNNWLLSTNLYPALDPEDVRAIAQALPEMFPDRAIVFRSIDTFRNASLHDALRETGHRMVLSRQVWYQAPEAARQKKQFRIDHALYRKMPYEVVEGHDLTDAEIERCADLYHLLYIEKYSHYNPDLTPAYLRLARDHNLLNLRALRHEGRIDAVMGYFARNGVMTQPLFGYDTRLPQSLALYRLLSVLTLLEGQRNGLLVHASAGVGPFKKLRGGVPVIEYNAVYDRHLSLRRRLPWGLLKALADTIAVPVFQRYGF